MPALVLETRSHAATLRDQIKVNVARFKQQSKTTPSLVIVAVGEDPSVYDYIRVVSRNSVKVGMRAYANLLPEDITKEELQRHLDELNANPNIHGISLQVPLPPHLSVGEVANFIAPEKDVEGLNPVNSGYNFAGKGRLVPPPALSGMKVLSVYNINPAGRHAVIVGRNVIIGKPLSLLLTEADATVTLCHRQTKNLPFFTRQADILVVAAQNSPLITAEMVKPGAVVMDFGINYINGKVRGDADFDNVRQIAGAITPMPGGTGPMTVVMLLENILKAAIFQAANKAL